MKNPAARRGFFVGVVGDAVNARTASSPRTPIPRARRFHPARSAPTPGTPPRHVHRCPGSPRSAGPVRCTPAYYPPHHRGRPCRSRHPAGPGRSPRPAPPPGPGAVVQAAAPAAGWGTGWQW
ncbi:hypothetical protein G6F56_014238 [Rhizopus delemar]|nr:hypothetical protein G6F56_014238 [Rhizopus delemar]